MTDPFLYLEVDSISPKFSVDLSKGIGPWSSCSPSSHNDLVAQHHPFPTHLLMVARGAGQISAERAKGRIVYQNRPK